MKATLLEFRFRVVIILAIVMLGFWSPWIEFLHIGTRTTAWLWLGFEVGALGVSSSVGIRLVTAGLIAAAAVAAMLRVWGTAYLGPGTVNSGEMKAGEQVLVDGPYRYVRNPLYLGSWLMMAVIASLMPASGALVSMILLAAFLLRLIFGEEAFLAAKLGSAYGVYRRQVPRLIPMLRSRVKAEGKAPDWGRAVLGEMLALGVLVSFAVLSWQYNALLLTRAVLVCLGISLVLRATLLAGRSENPTV